MPSSTNLQDPRQPSVISHTQGPRPFRKEWVGVSWAQFKVFSRLQSVLLGMGLATWAAAPFAGGVYVGWQTSWFSQIKGFPGCRTSSTKSRTALDKPDGWPTGSKATFCKGTHPSWADDCCPLPRRLHWRAKGLRAWALVTQDLGAIFLATVRCL